MINIVIPMAGRGSRFAGSNFALPKPFIEIDGKPMIAWVTQNIAPEAPHRFIFIGLRKHFKAFPHIKETLRKLSPNCLFLETDAVTEGAAATVLLAKNFINTEESLMIANSDQYVDISIDDYLSALFAKENTSVDGLVMTFYSQDPKWSYCRIDQTGYISEIVEKEVISDQATVGIYNFKHGRDFVCAAQKMIANNLRVKGEFYVAPVFNELISEGKKIIPYLIGKEGDVMHGLGLPEDLQAFMSYIQQAKV